MYHVANNEMCNSYATEANALKALEKRFGKSDDTSRPRRFNVLMTRNAAGRFVPVLMNITDGMYGMYAAAGFMVVN